MRRIDRNMLSAAITWAVIIYVLTVLGGCGGGTSGTGMGESQTTYVGSVVNQDGEPLASVRIENEMTGDIALTRADGKFALASERVEGEVSFRVESGTFASSFLVEETPPDVPQVSLNIVLNKTQRTLAVDRFTVTAGIVGACNIYFENRQVIRQANPVPVGQVCVARLTVSGDGRPRGHIPAAVLRSGCAPGALWEVVATAETFSGVHQGVAQIPFVFEDSEAACRYRIVAPYEFKEYVPVMYEVQTFTSQEYDRNTPASAATPALP